MAHETAHRLYRELHTAPELSGTEERTAARLAAELAALGVAVSTGVGGHGVVGVVERGPGPTVLLRAEMDALPIVEETGLPYASRVPGVMHACGHDLHCAALVAALGVLLPEAWSGTLVVVLQPAEETLSGARAMVDDGLFDRFPRPDVVLGQHVWAMPPGRIAIGPGVLTSAGDALRITVHGRGGHGSRPDTTVNPVTIAAHVATRIEEVVARETPPGEGAVVTVGSLHGGSASNVVADSAEILLSTRSWSQASRARLLAAIERIARGEAAAAGDVAEPTVEHLMSAPSVVNDPDATARVTGALTAAFGPSRVATTGPLAFSEDFGELVTAAGAPGVFWILGGPDAAEPVATNHSPRFAPVLEPTLTTAVGALVAAARAWLGSCPNGAGVPYYG